MEWLFTHFSLSKQIFFKLINVIKTERKLCRNITFCTSLLNWIETFFFENWKADWNYFFFPAYECSSLWNLFRLFSLALGKNCFLCFTNNELMNIKRTSWNLFKTKPMILLHIHVYLKLWQRKWNMQNTFMKIHVFWNRNSMENQNFYLYIVYVFCW